MSWVALTIESNLRRTSRQDAAGAEKALTTRLANLPRPEPAHPRRQNGDAQVLLFLLRSGIYNLFRQVALQDGIFLLDEYELRI